MNLDKIKVGILGLGYVGLPLAVEFSKTRKVFGFDINALRIDELRNGKDNTNEIEDLNLLHSSNLHFTSNIQDLSDCNFYIITVPTPIDANKKPNLDPLIGATNLVGSVLKEGDIVVYESTVYPGATEDDCVPVLENCSGLKFNQDFSVGYSPERINPGDKKHTLRNIIKIVSGSTIEARTIIDQLYSSIIDAGTYVASSIRVAEAAKIIENTQRDVNIALINELSLIFNKLEIDTEEVLNAAGTKWNFLPFKPGLVGGHCIGVDPYYLTEKAESIGYTPEIILAGRRLNDGMGEYISSTLISAIQDKGDSVENSSILIMGATFKENCPDIRNSKVFDIYHSLKGRGASVDIYDPWLLKRNSSSPIPNEIQLIGLPLDNFYSAIIVAVAHDEFRNMGINKIKSFGSKDCLIYDLKHVFESKHTNLRL